MRRATAVLAIALLVAGCPSRPPPVEPPQLRLERLEGGRAALAIINRDRRPLTLDALDWALTVGGVAVRRGRLRLEGALAAGERRDLVLDLPPLAGEPAAIEATLHARGGDGPIAARLDQPIRPARPAP